MDQACEELPPIPEIPGGGEEERKLYFITSRLQTVLLLVLIWNSRIYLISTYAALRASQVVSEKQTTSFFISFFPVMFRCLL